MKYTDGLESERLTTRFLTEDDIPVFLEYFEDPVNCRFMSIPDHLSNLKRSEIFINFQMKRYSENRLGLQAIITKDTGGSLMVAFSAWHNPKGKKALFCFTGSKVVVTFGLND